MGLFTIPARALLDTLLKAHFSCRFFPVEQRTDIKQPVHTDIHSAHPFRPDWIEELKPNVNTHSYFCEGDRYALRTAHSESLH